MSQDEDGYRTYTVQFKVQGVPGVDGPYNAMRCDDLPKAGTTWGSSVYGIFSSDIDPCAWCRPTVEVEPHPDTREGENPEFWLVTKTFSTRPQQSGRERCNNVEYCDPTDEIQKVTFEFSKITEEAAFDRFGRRILSSSHEPIHGPNNEWKFTLTTIVIEQNVTDGQHTLMEQIKDTVNDRYLWGFPPRTILFSPRGKSRQIRMTGPDDTGTGHGECQVYWTRTLAFEIMFRRREGVGAEEDTGTAIELTPVPGGPFQTWDRDVWDEGTRVLRGYWSNAAGGTGTGTRNRTHWTLIDIDGAPPDPDNPQHFIRFKDWNGENQRTLLDGAGKPAFVPTVVNQWWVVQSTYNDMPDADPLNHIIHVPCEAALRMARDIDTEFTTASVHGPFDSEADAQSAIDDEDLGSLVSSCLSATPSAGVVHIEKYGESNLMLLGIPSDLDALTPPFGG